jgi:flagellar motor protein MotB
VFDFLCGRTTLKPGQLFVVAHGPNHPVVSNATAAGRARNRRIELVVYPEQMAPETAASSADAGSGDAG